jgi:hypothetical protein
MIIGFLRHGEPIMNEQGEKGGLSDNGVVQVQMRAKEFRLAHQLANLPTLILEHGKPRARESAMLFAHSAHLDVRHEELGLLSNSKAAKQILLRRWYLLIFFVVLFPWLMKVKARLPKRARSINDARFAAGRLWWLINAVMTCYEEEATKDAWALVEHYKNAFGDYPRVLIFVGSEVSLQVVCRGIWKQLPGRDQAQLRTIESATLQHAEMMEVSLSGVVHS